MHQPAPTVRRDGTPPPLPTPADEPQAARARREMVARLEADGPLQPVIREALLALRLDVLVPRTYVRRVADGVEPGVWQLLDGSHPQDHDEWITTLYSGDSIRIQHDGERLDQQRRGMVTGGRITSLSSTMRLTASMLAELRLEQGRSYLDLGSGSGVTGAVACGICGSDRVTLLDRDQHLTDALRERLPQLGYRPQVVTGDGYGGFPENAPYDRAMSGFGVEYVPAPWVDQLACGGRLLATITTRSPSWPGRAVVERTNGGRIDATLRAVISGNRPAHGLDWLSVAGHRQRIAAEPGERRSTTLAPPEKTARGMWLALDYLAPGLVRDYTAEHLTLVAPGEDSWVVVRPDGKEGWFTESGGMRDVWAEVESVHARWIAAGQPSSYHLEFSDDGSQHVTSGTGRGTLEWELAIGAGTRNATPTGGRS